MYDSGKLLSVLVLYLCFSPGISECVEQLSSYRALTKLPQPAQQGEQKSQQ